MKIHNKKRATTGIIILFALLFFLQAGAQEKQRARKILYYRNPMNPAITSKVSMKDPMGMDYIPVYEGEEMPSGAQSGTIKLNPQDIALAGVKSGPVIKRELFKEIRTVGRIAYDPELYKAEEELIQAVKAKESLSKSNISEVKERVDALIEAAKQKLRLLGLSLEQIEDLSSRDQADRSLLISDEKYPFAWVYADIYEYEISWVKVGQAVKVFSVSFPQEEFTGAIEAIDPVLNPMTRSVRIRAKIDNPDLKLKPQMYADIFIEAYLNDEAGQHKPLLAVSKDAVLDTGMRKIVYVDSGKGSYVAREIKIGPEASAETDGRKDKFYPVYEGLEEGERVVTKANFLLDSQSQITGASGAFGGALGAEEQKPPIHQH